MRIVFLIAIAHLAAAAQPAPAMAGSIDRQRLAVQDAMEKSVARQRQSVRAQAASAVERPANGEDSFFTVPWPRTVPMPALAAADCAPLPLGEVEALIGESARREGLQPELLREVMRRESGFRPCAVSSAGAQGLMQLMPGTAQQFHVSDSFDPKQNTAAGAKFLKSLIDRYGGDLALALGAYNAGPGRVDEASGVPAIAETREYVRSILGAVLFQ